MDAPVPLENFVRSEKQTFSTVSVKKRHDGISAPCLLHSQYRTLLDGEWRVSFRPKLPSTELRALANLN
jgi:hypothetical protein